MRGTDEVSRLFENRNLRLDDTENIRLGKPLNVFIGSNDVTGVTFLFLD